VVSDAPPPLTPEPTIELSESDLERPPAFGLDESIHIPKRRSVLPWLALLLLCGAAGTKLWLDGRIGANDAANAGASSTSAVESSSASDAAIRVSDAGPAKPRVSGPHRPPPPKPATSAVH
jgi:hypothetical protein